MQLSARIAASTLAGLLLDPLVMAQEPAPPTNQAAVRAPAKGSRGRTGCA